MPLDFPNSPAVGATYSPPGISKSWIYTGEQWSAVTAPIEEGATVTVQDTPPSGASAGDLWFDSSSGVTSVYYDSTWVDVGGGDSGTSAGSVNGIVKSDGSGNFSAAGSAANYIDLTNFIGANQSLSQNGWQRLPGGLIIQWGEIIGVLVDDFTITLPITFPNRLFQAFGHDSGVLTTPAPPIYLLNWYTPSSGGIVGPVSTIRFRINNSGGIDYGNWIAIGY